MPVQRREVEQLRRDEALPLPCGFDFQAVPGLSAEMVERLAGARPASLAAASRVRGITPAAVTALLLHLKRAA